MKGSLLSVSVAPSLASDCATNAVGQTLQDHVSDAQLILEGNRATTASRCVFCSLESAGFDVEDLHRRASWNCWLSFTGLQVFRNI